MLSGAFVNEGKKKANKRKRNIWTRRWIEQRKKYGAYHSLITKRKVNKQQLTNQLSRFPQLVAHIRAGCYSDLGCATCCATQQQPMTDVQRCNKSHAARFRNKSPQQKSTCVIVVIHNGQLSQHSAHTAPTNDATS